LFFGLVAVCAVFFGLGYKLGRKSEMPLAASAGVPMPTAVLRSSSAAAQPAQQQMTFYKAVEQSNANAQLTPASDSTGAGPAPVEQSTPAPSVTVAGSSGTPQTASPENPNPPDPMAAIPSASYFVQVAAVSKQEDAQALVDALKQKQYPAFVANAAATDNLFRVQLGPFSDIKEAEAMRTRLINDGYNPILKK